MNGLGHEVRLDPFHSAVASPIADLGEHLFRGGSGQCEDELIGCSGKPPGARPIRSKKGLRIDLFLQADNDLLRGDEAQSGVRIDEDGIGHADAGDISGRCEGLLEGSGLEQLEFARRGSGFQDCDAHGQLDFHRAAVQGLTGRNQPIENICFLGFICEADCLGTRQPEEPPDTLWRRVKIACIEAVRPLFGDLHHDRTVWVGGEGIGCRCGGRQNAEAQQGNMAEPEKPSLHKCLIYCGLQSACSSHAVCQQAKIPSSKIETSSTHALCYRVQTTLQTALSSNVNDAIDRERSWILCANFLTLGRGMGNGGALENH
ncbi:MAG: hypothetical protein KA118_18115 [Verrucomicrobia bacterium]|nr:hypothetical protein [Verrucomicrobiota bacterium]